VHDDERRHLCPKCDVSAAHLAHVVAGVDLEERQAEAQRGGHPVGAQVRDLGFHPRDHELEGQVRDLGLVVVHL
jgi:hypothetical protein